MAQTMLKAPTEGRHEKHRMSFRTSTEDALLTEHAVNTARCRACALTIEQAMRLWNLDRQTCQSLLSSSACLLDSTADTQAHSGYDAS